jgi:hypothetical protein
VDRAGSGPCPVVGCANSGVEVSDAADRVSSYISLEVFLTSHFICKLYTYTYIQQMV